jgi:hypothetical protein
MKNINIIHLPYRGDNLEYLKAITNLTGHFNLYRASELCELGRVLKYGTDRGGYDSEKKWRDTNIRYEDVIFGTTESVITEAEKDVEKSSSFKKFAVIKDPVLLIYDILGFKQLDEREWLFINTVNKLQFLMNVVIL